MKTSIWIAALIGLALAASAAQAKPLKVVNVGAPAVNCVYNVSCTIVVNDSVGNFTPPSATGNSRLQSRAFDGAAPAPEAGRMGINYRVDMTGASPSGEPVCVTKLQVKFGAIVKAPYPPGALADIYVVTSGGLGSVGIASATQKGPYVTFNFDGDGVCPGATSYFFGLTTAETSPVHDSATIFYSDGTSVAVDDRIP